MKRVPDRARARAVPRFHDGICGGKIRYGRTAEDVIAFCRTVIGQGGFLRNAAEDCLRDRKDADK